MFVSKKWLEQLIDCQEVSAQALADRLSTTGIEVEGVSNIGEGLKKIVVGHTLDVVDHPDSDHLHVCQVNVGLEHAPEENGVLQIVCGAPNVASNQKVIVALPGARIVDNIKIKKGKIRGQVSNGMICSLDELGVSSNVVPKAYSEGIYLLPSDAPIGVDAIEYLELNDEVLELSVTANRADALSMYGTAYEVGAIYDKQPHFEIPNVQVDVTQKVSDYVSSLNVSDHSLSGAYRLCVIKDVTIQESPVWLQSILMKMGIRPVNNVVDVTNYMLLLYGQPMHAFDVNQLGDDITVRLAKSKETLVTLDGQLRELSQEDIVISSNNQAVALAGVMGGLDTEITSSTTTVALEVALFNPKRVRATSKRLGLRSESSARFEKGIHVDMMAHAAQHAAFLIAKLGQGQVVSDDLYVQSATFAPKVIEVSVDKINSSLGTTLLKDEITSILSKRLGFDVTANGNQLVISVPTRRFDMTIPADVVEEVARIYGYDNLPSTLPMTPSIQGGLSPLQYYLRMSRRLLESVGYSQVISYSLTSSDKSGRFSLENRQAIQLAMPMSEERSTLRRSLTTTLLDVAAYNVARSNTNLALYETGRVFYSALDDQPAQEDEHIALLLTGLASEKTWESAARAVDFYDLKGALEAYFKQMGIFEAVKYVASKRDNLHPGRQADIVFYDEVIGFIGQLHPEFAKENGLKETYVAEFNIKALLNNLPKALVQTTVPRYPGTSRDIALLVDKTISNAELVRIMKNNGGRYLVDIHLFDNYEGPGIEAYQKSLAYRLSFLNLEGTLVDEEITQTMHAIQEALVTELKVVVR